MWGGGRKRSMVRGIHDCPPNLLTRQNKNQPEREFLENGENPEIRNIRENKPKCTKPKLPKDPTKTTESQENKKKKPTERAVLGFWFLVCYAATQLAIQLSKEHIQVVRSNRVARKRPAESNGTPAMDLGFEDRRKRKYTNKRGINKTHIHKHATCRNSTYTKKELMLQRNLLLYCCGCIFHCVCYDSGLLSCG